MDENKRTKVDHLVYEREELYPTKNILKLFRIKPKTIIFLIK